MTTNNLTERQTLFIIKEQLVRPIAYNRVFARIGGGAAAALMLSQAWYWTQTEIVQKRGGWFYKSAKQWEEETGLTRREQETARKKLKERGLIQETLKGIPATVNFRINQERLFELLAQVNTESRLDKPAESDQSVQSSMSECANNSTKAPNKEQQKSQTITENTTENTQETTEQRIHLESRSINNTKEPLSASPPASLSFQIQDSGNLPSESLADASISSLSELQSQPEVDGLDANNKSETTRSYELSDTDPASQVFNDWREVMEYPEAIFNKKYRSAIASRLKEGYSVKDLKLAIRGALFSPWHMGKNDAKMVYDDIELICRDGTKVETFRKLALAKGVESKTAMTKSSYVEHGAHNASSTKSTRSEWVAGKRI